MITKIFYVLGTLTVGAALGLGYLNNQKLLTVRAEKVQTNSAVTNNINKLDNKDNGLVAQIVTLNTNIQNTTSELDEAREHKANEERKLAQANQQGSTLEGERGTVQAQIDEVNLKMKELPEGMTPDTLNEDINRMNQNIATNKERAEQLKKDIDLLNSDLKKVTASLADANLKQDRRRAVFRRNTLEGVVTGVNPDWGFVVLNRGSNAGLAPGVTLVLSRAGSSTGRVKIEETTANQSIARIEKSVVPASIQPGDTFILQKFSTP